jgi:hypothetical protein
VQAFSGFANIRQCLKCLEVTGAKDYITTTILITAVKRFIVQARVAAAAGPTSSFKLPPFKNNQPEINLSISFENCGVPNGATTIRTTTLKIMTLWIMTLTIKGIFVMI